MNERIVFDWVGDWEAPSHGKYVIRENEIELEPYQVIEKLDAFVDLLEQIRNQPRPSTNPPYPHDKLFGRDWT